jgi:hypothetical protein
MDRLKKDPPKKIRSPKKRFTKTPHYRARRAEALADLAKRGYAQSHGGKPEAA